jgi:antiviral helicase SLH1
MRAAIAEMKLDHTTGELPKYGQDILKDDEDLSAASSDEIWDIFSPDEVNGSSTSSLVDGSDEAEPTLNGENLHYNLEWLREKCVALTDHHRSGLDSDQLQDHLCKLLFSSMESELEISLTDLVKVY